MGLRESVPGCLMKSIDGIRQKKKFFWDQVKNDHRYWLATNMMGEAYLGFGAFNTKKITGMDTIDFIKNCQLIAKGTLNDDAYGSSAWQTAGEISRVAFKRGSNPPFLFSQEPVMRHTLRALNKEKNHGF